MSCNRRLGAAAATAALVCSVSVAGPAPSPPTFDQAFAVKGEPARLHYRVAYVAGGVEHLLEVWRDGDRRVKRVTDGAIQTYATHKPGDADYSLTVVDPRRRISTHIGRANLYRIGAFTDWFDLAHGLRRPKGAYRIAAAAAPPAAPRPLAPGRWFDLIQGAQTTHVCWSATSGLPLLIVTADGRTVWRVAEVDQRPPPAGVFQVHDHGFVRNDADRDVERD